MPKPPDWKTILQNDPEKVLLLQCPESVIDDLLLDVPSDNGIDARVVRGRRCQTEQDLFNEWAAALQFPYYFGDNWDAFEECLSDLEWLQGRHNIIILTGAEQVLRTSPERLDTFIGVLKGSLQGQADDSVFRRFVLQCQPEHAREVRQRYTKGGLPLE